MDIVKRKSLPEVLEVGPELEVIRAVDVLLLLFMVAELYKEEFTPL
jgi:hypothetical protein